jgi:hypothetical protein
VVDFLILNVPSDKRERRSIERKWSYLIQNVGPSLRPLLESTWLPPLPPKSVFVEKFSLFLFPYFSSQTPNCNFVQIPHPTNKRSWTNTNRSKSHFLVILFVASFLGIRHLMRLVKNMDQFTKAICQSFSYK